MKSLSKVLAVLILASMAFSTHAQVIMRGETSPGVYTNVAVDVNGKVSTSASSSTTSGPVAAGAAAANSDLVGGVYVSSPTTYTNGQQGALQVGTRGALQVQLMGADNTSPVTFTNNGVDAISNSNLNALRMFGFNQVFNGTTWDRQRGDTSGAYVVTVASAVGGYSFANMTTATTTTIKSGAGYFHTLTVGTAGTTSTVKCYDSLTATGTVIGTFSTLLATSMTFDIAFATGLTCITSGGAPADITFSYK